MARKHSLIGGLISAVLTAVASFFIIYLFFPAVADKYLGMHLKESEVVEQVITKVTGYDTSKVRSEAKTALVNSGFTGEKADAIVDKVLELKTIGGFVAAAEKGNDALVGFISDTAGEIDIEIDTQALSDTLSSIDFSKLDVSQLSDLSVSDLELPDVELSAQEVENLGTGIDASALKSFDVSALVSIFGAFGKK